MTKKEETEKGETLRKKYRALKLRKSHDSSKISASWLGTFITQEQEARVYDEASLRIRGQNAILNFPSPPSSPSPKPQDEETRTTTLNNYTMIPFMESPAYLEAVRSQYSEICQFVSYCRLRNQQREEYIKRVNSQPVELQFPSFSSIMERPTTPFSPCSSQGENSFDSEFMEST